MPESLPLDPLGGVVNYLDGNERCPSAVRQQLLENVAAALGVGIRVFAHETEEDWQVINALAGFDSDAQFAADESVDGALKTDVGLHSEIFLARMTGDQKSLEVFAQRLELLHDTARDLTGRLN